MKEGENVFHGDHEESIGTAMLVFFSFIYFCTATQVKALPEYFPFFCGFFLIFQ